MPSAGVSLRVEEGAQLWFDAVEFLLQRSHLFCGTLEPAPAASLLKAEGQRYRAWFTKAIQPALYGLGGPPYHGGLAAFDRGT